MAVKEPRADQIVVHALRQEMTRSERRRAQVLLTILIAASAVFSIAFLTIGDVIQAMFNGRPPYGLVAAILPVAIGYAVAMYWYLDRLINLGKAAPTWLKFVSAFVE